MTTTALTPEAAALKALLRRDSKFVRARLLAQLAELIATAAKE